MITLSVVSARLRTVRDQRNKKRKAPSKASSRMANRAGGPRHGGAMRSVLLVGALGFAILGGGQTIAGQRAVQEVPIQATNSVESGNVLRFSGNVQISLGNYVVVADEVDVPLNGTGTLQLRG